ncbi:hypothetical protein EP342_00480 [bacterium]|nr:MAG: hypothetical protein EP342_00480 [bacterium]
MKKLIFISIFLILITTLWASTLDFTRLNARPEGDNVVVEWILGEESGVASYEVYRANNGFYTKIADKDAKGDNTSYKFVDVEAFIKNSKSAQVHEKIDLKYKIKVRYNNGTFKDSQDIEVSYNVSSVKRTWGMIKELFR